MPPGLADSASPYLRAHATNPVAWHAWGEEAFAEAARRDVPVLVSIGYSTCHWCHVMARESFQDEAAAAELNAGFVAIKVDREEHPEVDEAYLAAASAFTRNLGWPLTVFTTPHARAFFAGTYLPPEPRDGMPSFRRVLAAVQDAWTDRRPQVFATADAVAAALATVQESTPAADPPSIEDLERAARTALAREDREFGGFAAVGAGMTTPKFPTVPLLRFLQAPVLRAGVPEAGDTVRRAVRAMAASALRDGVDGGFFRYATRRDWTVPHYERMLTDNAGLIPVALDAGQTEVAEQTAGFLVDVLQRPDGGFAAAQDSESWIDGVRSEGGYYLRDAAARAGLAAPAIDGKIVTGWNGLAIGALARAGRELDRPALIDAARRAADAVRVANTAPDGRLRRASLGDVLSKAPATLEDHGLLAAGLLELADACGDRAYAAWAAELVDACLTDPAHPAPPGGRDPVLAVHGIPAGDVPSDGDHPSGPSALAGAALALWHSGEGERFREAAVSVIRTHARRALSEPLAHGAMLRAAADLSGR